MVRNTAAFSQKNLIDTQKIKKKKIAPQYLGQKNTRILGVFDTLILHQIFYPKLLSSQENQQLEGL